jgi:thiol-disulfide isomerase/thioredoxin
MIPRRVLVVLMVLLAAGVGYSHSYVKDIPKPDEIDSHAARMMAEEMWQGRLAPNFSLDTLDGDDFELSDHVGDKVIILNFWATWCAPCREEIPELNRYHEESSDDVMMVGVNVREDLMTVRGYVRNIEMDYPVVLDREGRVAKMFQVNQFPTTVVIGARGRVQFYKVGMIQNANAAFKDVVTDQTWRLGESDASISREEFLERQEESR